jgi:hypothetical protein
MTPGVTSSAGGADISGLGSFGASAGSGSEETAGSRDIISGWGSLETQPSNPVNINAHSIALVNLIYYSPYIFGVVLSIARQKKYFHPAAIYANYGKPRC